VSIQEHASFEPINLTDSSFAITSPPPSVQTQSRYSPPPDDSETGINFNALHGENDVCTMTNDKDLSVNNFKSKEFKPDLIKSNSDICSSLNQFDRFERHLPDIASTDVEVKIDEKVDFDLITNSVAGNVDSSSNVDTSTTTTGPETPSLGTDWQHLQEEYNKLTKIYENCANKLLIEVPSATEIGSYKERNEIEINDLSNNTAAENKEAVGCPLEGGERTSLNLDTYTGNVAVVEIVDKSDSDDNETESSMLEATSTTSTEDTFNINNEIVVDRISIKKPTESSIETTGISSFGGNVASDAMVCEVDESENSSATNNVVEQMLQTEHNAVEKDNCSVISEPTVVSEITHNEAQIVVSQIDNIDNSLENDVTCPKEITVNSQSTGKSTQDESISTLNADIRRDSDSLLPESENDQTAERLSSSENIVENDAGNETNAASTSQMKVQRPDSLALTQTTQNSEMSSTSAGKSVDH